jgi:hypothetical protein
LRAFVTARTGVFEIWLANADGTNERPLVTSVPALLDSGDDGVPSLVQWSPDGKWIAFTVFPRYGNADLRSHLYVVPASGGGPRRLGQEAYALDNPTWSRDSKSLYTAQGWPVDDRSHDSSDPIVRVDLATGTLSPIGVDGMWPRVSPDGKFLYFFTSRTRKLSRIPTNGGTAEELWDREDLLWYSASVGSRFLYLFQEGPRNGQAQTYKLLRFDPESRVAIAIAEVPFRPRFAHLSQDEHFFYFQQEDEPRPRIVLVEGLF